MNKNQKYSILFIIVNKKIVFLREKNIETWNWFIDPITTQK